MEIFAALLMTVGSLSVFNSSLVALMSPSGSDRVTSRRQYALGFCLNLVGAAANNLQTQNDLDVGHQTGVLVSFQNVICCAAFSMSGLLMLPKLSEIEENSFLQSSLTIFVTLGSTLMVMSAVIHYFHTLALAWAHVRTFVRTSEEEKLICGDIASDERDAAKHGYFRRLRDAIRARGRSLIWGEGKQGETHAGKKHLRFQVDEATDNDPEFASRDGYDASSFSSVDTISESSSCSGSEEGQPDGRRPTSE